MVYSENSRVDSFNFVGLILAGGMEFDIISYNTAMKLKPVI